MNNDDLDQFERTARSQLKTELQRVSVPQRRTRMKPNKESAWRRGALASIALIALLALGAILAINTVKVPHTAQQASAQPSLLQTSKPIIYTFVRNVDLTGVVTGGSITAIDPANGRVVWEIKRTTDNPDATSSFSVGSNYWLAGTISPDQTTLYVADSYRVTALKALDGSEVWSRSWIRNDLFLEKNPNTAYPLSLYGDLTFVEGQPAILNDDFIYIHRYGVGWTEDNTISAEGNFASSAAEAQYKPSQFIVTYNNDVITTWELQNNQAFLKDIRNSVDRPAPITLPISGSLRAAVALPNSSSILLLDQDFTLTQFNLATQKVEQTHQLDIVEPPSSMELSGMMLSPDQQNVLIPVYPKKNGWIEFWEYDRTTGTKTRIFNEPSTLVQMQYGSNNTTLYGVTADEVHKNSLYAFENNQPRLIKTFAGQIVGFVVGRDQTPQPTPVVASAPTATPVLETIAVEQAPNLGNKQVLLFGPRFDPTNQWVGSALRGYDLNNQRSFDGLDLPKTIVDVVMYSPYGVIYTVSSDNQLQAINSQTNAIIWSQHLEPSASIPFFIGGQPLPILTLSVANRLLYVQQNSTNPNKQDNWISVYSAANGQLLRKLPNGTDSGIKISTVIPSPDFKQVISDVRWNEIWTWDQSSDQPVKTPIQTLATMYAATSYADYWIIFVDQDSIVWSYNNLTHELHKRFNLNLSVEQMQAIRNLNCFGDTLTIEFAVDGIEGKTSITEIRQYDLSQETLLRTIPVAQHNLRPRALARRDADSWYALSTANDQTSLVVLNADGTITPVQTFSDFRPYRVMPLVFPVPEMPITQPTTVPMPQPTAPPLPNQANAPQLWALTAHLLPPDNTVDGWSLQGVDLSNNTLLQNSMTIIEPVTPQSPQDFILDSVASPDGKFVYVLDQGMLRAVELATGSHVWEYAFDKPDVAREIGGQHLPLIAISPDGQELYVQKSWGEQGQEGKTWIDVYNANTGQSIRKFDVNNGMGMMLPALSDGKRVFNFVQPNNIWTWHDADLKPTITTIKTLATPFAIVGYPKEDRLLYIDTLGNLWNYDMNTYKATKMFNLGLTMEESASITRLALGGNDTLIVDIGNREVRTYALLTQKPLRISRFEHSDLIVQPNPDGGEMFAVINDTGTTTLVKLNFDDTLTKLQALPDSVVKRLMLISNQTQHESAIALPTPAPEVAPTQPAFPIVPTEAPVLLEPATVPFTDDGSLTPFPELREGEIAWVYTLQGILHMNRDGSTSPVLTNPAWQNPVFTLDRDGQPPLVAVSVNDKLIVVDPEKQEAIATFDYDINALSETITSKHLYTLAPDQHRFAFVNQGELLIADLRNNSVRVRLTADQIANGEHWRNIQRMDWTKQGIYLYSKTDLGSFTLVSLDPDSTNNEYTGIIHVKQLQGVRWSNSGDLIAFNTGDLIDFNNKTEDLILLNLTTNQQTTLEGILTKALAFSPDNSQLAYIKQNGSQYDLIVYTILTKTYRTVASYKTLGSPTLIWSDDGRWLIVHNLQNTMQISVFSTQNFALHAHYALNGMAYPAYVKDVKLSIGSTIIQPIVINYPFDNSPQAEYRPELVMYNPINHTVQRLNIKDLEMPVIVYVPK